MDIPHDGRYRVKQTRDALSAELLAVVDQTVKPTRASLCFGHWISRHYTAGPKLPTRCGGWWYLGRCPAAQQDGYRSAVPACTTSSRCLSAGLVKQIREHRAMRLEPSLGGDWAHLPGRVVRERLSHPVADAPQTRLGAWPAYLPYRPTVR